MNMKFKVLTCARALAADALAPGGARASVAKYQSILGVKLCALSGVYRYYITVIYFGVQT